MIPSTTIKLGILCKLFFIFLFWGPVSAGSNYQEYESAKNVREKAIIALDLWNYYLRNDLDSLKINGFDLLYEGLEKKSDFAINVAKRSLGSYFIRSGNTPLGIRFLKESRAYFQKKEDYVLLTEILNELGNGHLNSGKPKEAEKYYLASLREGKQSTDPTSAYLAESNLAQAYLAMNNISKAIGILHHCKNLALKDMKLETVSSVYALLGTAEQTNGNVRLALEYYRKSADFAFKSKTKSMVAQAYNNMAIVYFMEGKTDESLTYFEKALEIRRQTSSSRSICESIFNLGEFYLEMKDYKKARSYYNESISESKKAGLLKDEMDATKALVNLSKLEGNSERALEELEQFTVLQEKYYSELAESSSEEADMINLLESMERDAKQEKNTEKAGAFNGSNVYYLWIFVSLLICGIILFVIRKSFGTN